MKRDCNTCVYKEGSCYPSTMIFDKDKTCKSYVPDYEDYIAELENENAELKKRIEWLDMAIDCDIPVADKIAELEKKLKTSEIILHTTFHMN